VLIPIFHLMRSISVCALFLSDNIELSNHRAL
jgi:hypothetical protein